nr:immunoglobulin light chain junction region [Macaca mulatta]
CQQHAYSPRTF